MRMSLAVDKFDPDAPSFEKIRRKKEEIRSQKVVWKMCLKKTRYRSAAYALKVIEDIQGIRSVSLRAYECPLCQSYHLTSCPPLESVYASAQVES